MSNLRAYQIDFEETGRRVCVTDEENTILYPEHSVPHVLVVYGGGDILDFEWKRTLIPLGSKVVMLRTSHYESMQLLSPALRDVATVHSVSWLPREQYDSVAKDFAERSRKWTEAETRIRAGIAKRIELAKRRLKNEEDRAIEKLGEKPSLDELLRRHVSTQRA